ncbi:MAG: 4-hydroxybenzoate octaprenyltransferase [Gammaproteobacteria bacterium]|nr:4-hydroxybenzoate octaprenyltransferase [Gammaproteobacteria bacterium]
MKTTLKLNYYAQLMRLDKPIGALLLLWPTLWALWLAAQGLPNPLTLGIFIAGVFIMRTVGCVINDIADRKIDAQVTRTRNRPLAKGVLTLFEAVSLAIVLFSIALILVVFCRPLTLQLAFVGAALTLVYPFTKRFLNTPQIFLGAAFAWGIPMAYAEMTGHVPFAAWILYLAALVWPVIYDTMYAMVDRADDIKIPIRSTAIFFGSFDLLIIILLQIIFMTLMILVGQFDQLHLGYYVTLVVVAGLFTYQNILIKSRLPADCFLAFKNNNWVGMVIFLGIVWDFAHS